MVKKMVIHGLPDGAGPGDIVGALSNEAGIDGRLIGKISFIGERAIVEVDKRIYKKVVQVMDGNSIAGHQVQVSEETGLEKVEKYVQGFNRLVQLEREEEMERFLYEVKKIPGLERQKRGRALLHLQAFSEEKKIAGGYLLSLSLIKGDSLPRTEMDVGDLVILSQENPISGNRKMGMMAEAEEGYVTLFFDEPLEEWFFQKNLRLDLYLDDGMYKDIYSALKRMKSPETSSNLCDILLNLATPGPISREVSTALYDLRLNSAQRKAAHEALSADDLYLIKGGPGTGKTRVLKELIRQSLDQGQKILVTSGSTRGLNQLLLDLQEEGLNAIGLGYPFEEENTLLSHMRKIPSFIEALQRKEDLSSLELGERGARAEEIQKLEQEALEGVLERFPALFCPANACGCKLLSSSSFDLLLVDDASQIIEPLMINPFLNAKKAILAGDPISLSPNLLNPRAKEEGLAISIFEKLFHLYGESHSSQFTVQHRMNGALNNFIEQRFYQGELEVADEVSLDGLGMRKIPGLSPGSMAVNRKEPLLFFDTSSMGARERSWCNYRFCENPIEADLVVEIISSFLYAGLNPSHIGVISPYVEHSSLIRKSLSNPDVLVGPPSRFHGLERDVIIISLVRNNTKGWLGKLKDIQSMNVALSRSKKKTILIGSGETIGHHPFYQSLQEYIKEHGFFYDL